MMMMMTTGMIQLHMGFSCDRHITTTLAGMEQRLGGREVLGGLLRYCIFKFVLLALFSIRLESVKSAEKNVLCM